MKQEVREAAKVILDDTEGRKALYEGIMDHGARSSMARAIGDRTPAQFDKADKIAEGISRGTYNSLRALAGVDNP